MLPVEGERKSTIACRWQLLGSVVIWFGQTRWSSDYLYSCVVRCVLRAGGTSIGPYPPALFHLIVRSHKMINALIARSFMLYQKNAFRKLSFSHSQITPSGPHFLLY